MLILGQSGHFPKCVIKTQALISELKKMVPVPNKNVKSQLYSP